MVGRGGRSGRLCGRCFGQHGNGRMRSLRVLAEAHLVWARKGPADERPAGPLHTLFRIFRWF